MNDTDINNIRTPLVRVNSSDKTSVTYDKSTVSSYRTAGINRTSKVSSIWKQTTTPGTTGVTNTTKLTVTNGENIDTRPSLDVIIGAVLGGIFLVLVVFISVLVCQLRRKKKEINDELIRRSSSELSCGSKHQLHLSYDRPFSDTHDEIKNLFQQFKNRSSKSKEKSGESVHLNISKLNKELHAHYTRKTSLKNDEEESSRSSGSITKTNQQNNEVNDKYDSAKNKKAILPKLKTSPTLINDRNYYSNLWNSSTNETQGSSTSTFPISNNRNTLESASPCSVIPESPEMNSVTGKQNNENASLRKGLNNFKLPLFPKFSSKSSGLKDSQNLYANEEISMETFVNRGNTCSNEDLHQNISLSNSSLTEVTQNDEASKTCSPEYVNVSNDSIINGNNPKLISPYKVVPISEEVRASLNNYENPLHLETNQNENESAYVDNNQQYYNIPINSPSSPQYKQHLLNTETPPELRDNGAELRTTPDSGYIDMNKKNESRISSSSTASDVEYSYASPDKINIPAHFDVVTSNDYYAPSHSGYQNC